MESLIDTIRTAVGGDASAEARAAGAQACRTILAALEAKPGESLASTPAPVTSPLQTLVGALRTMPPEQFLDLAIARLKAALPTGTDVSAVESVRIPLLPIATLGGRS